MDTTEIQQESDKTGTSDKAATVAETGSSSPSSPKADKNSQQTDKNSQQTDKNSQQTDKNSQQTDKNSQQTDESPKISEGPSAPSSAKPGGGPAKTQGPSPSRAMGGTKPLAKIDVIAQTLSREKAAHQTGALSPYKGLTASSCPKDIL